LEVSTLVVSETVSILVSDLFTFRLEQEVKQTTIIIAIINIIMMLSFLFGVVVIFKYFNVLVLNFLTFVSLIDKGKDFINFYIQI
jgi:hypothetical protein